MIDAKIMSILSDDAEETICLLRKRIEMINDEHADELDADDIDELHHIYEILRDIAETWKAMPMHQ